MVMVFGARVSPDPVVIAVLALALDTVLLFGGVVGFALFARYGRPKAKRKGKSR
jgi:Sec-independent protein secretion pathway component TatC